MYVCICEKFNKIVLSLRGILFFLLLPTNIWYQSLRRVILGQRRRGERGLNGGECESAAPLMNMGQNSTMSEKYLSYTVRIVSQR